jgi:hypothetical protein
MPIQSDDIQLLKSAVMADVPEGGGGATGTVIADGVSNNIFNDISTDDRAGGDFSLRKVFGVAHTADTDTLLGAGFSVMAPPEDPKVSVLMFETPGWFDTRTEAVNLVERYLVKGPALLCRLADVHYEGSTILNLYNLAPGTGFPASGDAIVLRNADGSEQYLRVLRTTLSSQTVSTDASGVYTVNLCACELSEPLERDFLGAPVQRVEPGNAARALSTAPAVGAVFHGVKPLASLAGVGATSVYAEGGILASLVPASTVPQPVTDQFPLTTRPALSRTATSALTTPATTVTLGPGAVLQLPTTAQPGSVSVSHGATVFTSNAAGELLQGSTVVGSVDVITRRITLAGTAPAYGAASTTVTLTPATRAGAAAHSIGLEIDTANQSTAWVLALQPPPAPGTITLAYMAQDRWYELTEDGSGKLAGADSAVGSGTVNFVTGSLAATLGAAPDVGGTIVVTWGEATSAEEASGKPTRAWAYLPLAQQPGGNITVTWSRGGTNYTAVVSPTGAIVSGPAQARAPELQASGAYLLPFSPDTLPDGPVDAAYAPLARETGFVNNGGGSYTLTAAPVRPGSVRFRAIGSTANGEWAGGNQVFQCYSAGTEVFAEGVGVIGSINNTTGAMALTHPGFSVTGFERVRAQGVSQEIADYYNYYKLEASTTTYTLALADLVQIDYASDAAPGAPVSNSAVPGWVIEAAQPSGASAVTTDAAFTWAGAFHFVRDGQVFRGFNVGTGAAEARGAMTSAGSIGLGQGAPGGANAITWHNLARDRTGAGEALQGVFRTPVAPLSPGQLQLQVGALVGAANTGGAISGAFQGSVDFERGIVRWGVAGLIADGSGGAPIPAAQLTYNAVFLQYVPLDAALLGVSTTRLPVDGRVPIFRAGGHAVVHHTATTALPNPLTKGTAYDLGRERLAFVALRDAAGQRLPGDLFTVDLDAGTLTVPTASDLTPYTQPLTAEHRVEDELLVIRADLSGRLDLAGAITHTYPAAEAFVSSKLRLGDRFARVFGYADRATWQGSWDATEAGSDTLANYNATDFPITTTNRGAITERWAFIFTGTTAGRLVGEGVGQVLTNVSITAPIEPLNPQTGVPYLSIPAEGWGGGWAVGNVLLFETVAAGGPAWLARTVLPGASAVLDDRAVIALRADVDRP